MTLACFYCPPQLEPVASFETMLFDALQFVPNESNLIVLGDFNAARIDPSGNKHRNPKTELLLEALEALDLTLANERANRHNIYKWQWQLYHRLNIL